MKGLNFVSDIHAIFLAFILMKSYMEAEHVKQKRQEAALVWREGDVYPSFALDHHTSHIS